MVACVVHEACMVAQLEGLGGLSAGSGSPPRGPVRGREVNVPASFGACQPRADLIQVPVTSIEPQVNSADNNARNARNALRNTTTQRCSTLRLPERIWTTTVKWQ
jgi:hypothetical protein